MIKKIKAVKPPYPFEAYTHVITPLSEEEGGGFLITFPDIPAACLMVRRSKKRL